MTSPSLDPTPTIGDPRQPDHTDPLHPSERQRWPGPGAGPQSVGTDPDEAEQEASYARYQAENRSLGEIATDLLDNATTLIRQEVELAKVEAKQSAIKAGKGAAMLTGAALTALLGLIAVTLALWWALALLLGTPEDPALGWSGLVVAALWFAIAAALAAAGKSELTKMRGLPRTTDTIKKIPNAAAGNEEKNR